MLEDFERDKEGRKRKRKEVRKQEDFNTDKIYVKTMWKVGKLVYKHRDNRLQVSPSKTFENQAQRRKFSSSQREKILLMTPKNLQVISQKRNEHEKTMVSLITKRKCLLAPNYLVNRNCKEKMKITSKLFFEKAMICHQNLH